MKLIVYIWLFLVMPLAAFSQEYGYTHYNSRDGLAGATVYCMTQDRDGFLWLGTEGGLSRFDGTHFKNFSREDGLPDNEIIQLFADSKGRIWIAPFRKSVCYYYKGKIHTPDNDPMLKRIPVVDYIMHFAEDEAGNILMHEFGKMYLVTPQGQVRIIDSINGKPFIQISSIGNRPGGGFRVIHESAMYDFVNGHFHFLRSIPAYGTHYSYFTFNARALVWRSGRYMMEAGYIDRPGTVSMPCPEKQINMSLLDDNRVASCSREGATLYDMSGADSTRHFLPGVPVNNMLKDSEGNIWFGTAGHGLYKLGSLYVLNLKLRDNNQPNQVFAFAKHKGTILVTTELNVIYKLNSKTGRLSADNIQVTGAGV